MPKRSFAGRCSLTAPCPIFAHGPPLPCIIAQHSCWSDEFHLRGHDVQTGLLLRKGHGVQAGPRARGLYMTLAPHEGDNHPLACHPSPSCCSTASSVPCRRHSSLDCHFRPLFTLILDSRLLSKTISSHRPTFPSRACLPTSAQMVRRHRVLLLELLSRVPHDLTPTVSKFSRRLD